MPRITINVKDLTSPVSTELIENIVYMPGFAGTDATATTGPVLCRTKKEFRTVFGTKAATVPNKTDDGGDNYAIYCSFLMAETLLDDGLYVLYEVPTKESNSVTTPVTTVADFTTAVKTADFWNKLKDKGFYDFRFITLGCSASISAEDIKVINANIKAVSEARKDCTAVLDHAAAETKDNLLNIEKREDCFGSVADKFTRCITPWCKFEGNDDNGKAISGVELPGSFFYLESFANSVKNNNAVWFSNAGVIRGVAAHLGEPLIKYGSLDIEQLQPETGEDLDTGESTFAVNPIAYVRPYGFRIWGNRTAEIIDSTITKDASLKASHFANVMEGVVELSKTLYNSSVLSMFEQNSDVLWNNFKNLIEILLDRMLSNQGVKGYKITRVNSAKKGTLSAIVRIIPTEGVEFFNLTIELGDDLTITLQ